MRSLLVCCVVLLGACGINPVTGALKCAPTGKACPDGYDCLAGRCWKPGTGPTMNDMADSDGATTPDEDMAKPMSANGESCNGNTDCTSGFCVDNVCCDRACDGQCEQCNGAVKGTCGPAPQGAPVGGRTPCAGAGACAGSCDGTASTCKFPPAATICGGACDGVCDGAGTCSGSGGVCPGGFVCGGAMCKTSCAGNMDCQPFHTCNMLNNQCERVPESDCLDGVDNNGDGKADCADPTCAPSQVTCVPSVGAGATLGIVLDSGPCPTGYESIDPLRQSLTSAPCLGCTCQSRCRATLTAYTNAGCSGSSASTTFTAVPLAGAVCQQMVSGTRASQTITSLSVYDCAGAGTATQAAPTWSTNKVYCVAKKSQTCAANQVCVPKPAVGTTTARVPETDACPMGYGGGSTVYYTGYTAGSCGACTTCSKATTMTCNPFGGSNNSATCASGSGTTPADTTCGGISYNPVAAGYLQFTKTGTDNCVPTPSKTEPTPTGGQRICAMP